jgi:hypothetical protein
VRPTGVRALVVLLTFVMLAGCSGDGGSAGAPPVATGPASSSSPAVRGDSALDKWCRAGQLSATAVDASGTRGDSVMGTWTVPFALVNLGRSCRLDPHEAFVRSADRVMRLGSVVRLPADSYVVMHVLFGRRHSACDPRDLTLEPLQLGIRLTQPGLTAVRAETVADVNVPRGALSCPQQSLLTGLPARRVPAELASRATRPMSLRDVPIETGLPAGDLTEPMFLVGPGVQLPLFCGEDRGGYDAGAVARRTVAVSTPHGSEVRQLDVYTSSRRARQASSFLLDAIHSCPQHGQTGFTTALFASPVGAGSWALNGVDRGTGAGPTRMRWIVVHDGRHLVIDLATGRAIHGEDLRLQGIVGPRPMLHA